MMNFSLIFFISTMFEYQTRVLSLFFAEFIWSLVWQEDEMRVICNQCSPPAHRFSGCTNNIAFWNLHFPHFFLLAWEMRGISICWGREFVGIWINSMVDVSLWRAHANLLCLVPILVYVQPMLDLLIFLKLPLFARNFIRKLQT